MRWLDNESESKLTFYIETEANKHKSTSDKKSVSFLKFRAMTYLLLYGGLRAEEILSINNIAFENSHFTIKGHRFERSIPNHPYIQKAIEEYWSLLSSPAEKQSIWGYKPSIRSLQRALKTIGEQAGITGVRPKALRYTFLNNMVNKKIPLSEMIQITGLTPNTIVSMYQRSDCLHAPTGNAQHKTSSKT